jgi:hypothetical protein
VSRQLRGWADSLQNSQIKGQRYLTDRERKDFQSRKEQAEFMDTLKTCIKKDRPGEEICNLKSQSFTLPSLLYTFILASQIWTP